MQRKPGLVITSIAVIFLGIDGVALVYAGIWAGRPGLIVWGVIFLAGTAAVIAYYRHYLRQIEQLRAARAEMKLHVELMQRAVRDGEQRADE